MIPDPKGEILRDADHAWEAARATIRQILRDQGQDKLLLNASLEVTDTSGDIVLEFPFSEALLDSLDPSQTKH